MHNSSTQGIIILIIGISLLLLLFILFIVTIVYRYQQKQYLYLNEIASLKTAYENSKLQSQLEIQEQTFQFISREIHDNIGQKLTLAKLLLNTINYTDTPKIEMQVNDSVNFISESINDLSNLSHSMSSEIILNNGLIKALEMETAQLRLPGIYDVNFTTTGSPVFMNSDTELLVFRIVQETLNNIIKHAQASIIKIILHYNTQLLTVEICDNGKGFDTNEIKYGTGLLNIKKRASILKGSLSVNSIIGTGTTVKLEIPFYANNKNL